MAKPSFFFHPEKYSNIHICEVKGAITRREKIKIKKKNESTI